MSAYVALEDGEENHADHAPSPKKRSSGRWWLRVFFASVTIVLLGWVVYDLIPPDEHKEARQIALLASIPIVALFFTWFHIWLAIQMMFLPVRFFGIWEYRGTGIGLGWQGVVPRKALKMARTAFTCARPYLLGPRQWLERVNAQSMVERARPHLTKIIAGALESVARQHYPDFWEEQLPESVREEMVIAALEKIKECMPQLWGEFTELLCDKDIGIDNDGMIVTVFMENKALLNTFFLTMGEQEFRFIERCGAALGFVCGCVQLACWREMQGTAKIVLLPLTGFFLGIVTNWLAIQMCFRPVIPKPVHICGKHVADIQGLFLKRQPEVCECYARMLNDHFFNFTKVLQYLQTTGELWDRLVEVYLEHNTRVLNKVLGPVAARLAPLVVGKDRYLRLEREVKMEMVERIAKAYDMHKVLERYIGAAANIFRCNRDAMAAMPPDQFENLLHPVFQEDEWILVLLGGILGAVVGIAQVHFLSE